MTSADPKPAAAFPSRRALITGALASAAALPAHASGEGAGPYVRTQRYLVERIEGWYVFVNPVLASGQPELAAETLKLLGCKLYAIARVLPRGALARLHSVRIWVEHKSPPTPCMVYHPAPEWLRDHGINPDKAKCVELANASNFLTWEHDQPWMVLHELAHAYHDQILSFENPRVKSVFDHAASSHRYDSVLNISGRMMRHYALTNVMEYFAELTEAFFGTNDFYPFVRAELREHDPEGYALAAAAWSGKV